MTLGSIVVKIHPILIIILISTSLFIHNKQQVVLSLSVPSPFRLTLSSSLNRAQRRILNCNRNGREDNDNDISSAKKIAVEVWDGVFTPKVCSELLIDLALDHSERTAMDDGSSVFVHSKKTNRLLLTPLEQALDSFLTEYYHNDDCDDKSVVVEYWCRQEHSNLEAHVDVDETWFEENEFEDISTRLLFRTPTAGHVLYLSNPTVGVGPTCVFPTSNNNIDEGVIANEISSVITIPAVPGRVLRFPGSALHAVPKPANIWTNKGEDGAKICDDDDGDDERHVVIFNTWEGIGPKSVLRDPIFLEETDISTRNSVSIPEGIEICNDDMKEYARNQRERIWEEWKKRYSNNYDNGITTTAKTMFSKVLCCPKTHWKSATINNYSSIAIESNDDDDENHIDNDNSKTEIDTVVINVPLLGDEKRWRNPTKYIRWCVPETFVERGVSEICSPAEFPLK